MALVEAADAAEKARLRDTASAIRIAFHGDKDAWSSLMKSLRDPEN